MNLLNHRRHPVVGSSHGATTTTTTKMQCSKAKEFCSERQRRKREKKDACSDHTRVSKVRVMHSTGTHRRAAPSVGSSSHSSTAKQNMSVTTSTSTNMPMKTPMNTNTSSPKSTACLHRSQEIKRDAQRPPSPTSVKEFVRYHPAREEEKEGEIFEDQKEGDCSYKYYEWNQHIDWDRFACGHALPESFSGCDEFVCSNNDNDSSAAAKGWNDFTQTINTKMEDIQEQYHINHEAFQKILALRDDLGDLAVTALQKNRNEMEELVGTIDKEAKAIDSSVVNPMNWIRDNQVSIDKMYNQSMNTCSNTAIKSMNTCSNTAIKSVNTCSNTAIEAFSAPLVKKSGKRDVIMVVQLPSTGNETGRHRSTSS